jgi:hypothetical protein
MHDDAKTIKENSVSQNPVISYDSKIRIWQLLVLNL